MKQLFILNTVKIVLDVLLVFFGLSNLIYDYIQISTNFYVGLISFAIASLINYMYLILLLYCFNQMHYLLLFNKINNECQSLLNTNTRDELHIKLFKIVLMFNLLTWIFFLVSGTVILDLDKTNLIGSMLVGIAYGIYYTLILFAFIHIFIYKN